MLTSLKHIQGYKLATPEGQIGKCKDALFDDEKWTIRYLDVDTGGWLSGRRVLISPISLGEPNGELNTIPTCLTKKQIEESPELETNAPVSRQWEDRYYTYYGWPHYAVGGYVWGYYSYPTDLLNSIESQRSSLKVYDAHLRSVNEVCGYSIKAQDDTFGSVKDMIFDNDTWTIRYLVIDTVKWIPSKNVLISPDWVSEINWGENLINIELTKEQIKSSPEYDESTPINKEYEVRLYDFYGRPRYWEKDYHQRT